MGTLVCRAVFNRTNTTTTRPSSSISLDNLGEAIRWARFLHHDWESLQVNELQTSVKLSQLLLLLGVDQRDFNHTTIALAPGLILSCLLILPSPIH